ncbi:MAG: uroporphyrinogen decarboxylase family protein [Verrucomicrobiota bacterium]|nr:uroporphyrinogen decarboxylase family protein [Verrucomicrobiota bacterium]
MTPRERWLALFNHQKPDRIPTDIWATPEVYQKLYKHTGTNNRYELSEKLYIDSWRSALPLHTVHHHPEDAKANIWGLRFRNVEYAGGSSQEAENTPLAHMEDAEELDDYHWPNPDDVDWDKTAEQIDLMPEDRIICGGHYEPFLLYCWMRGTEKAMMDLADNPDFAFEALDRIFEYHLEVNRRMWEVGEGRIDVMYMAEDLGSQTSLLMSRRKIQEFILPYQKEMADCARSYGVHIFYHSDGAIHSVIPDLINITGIEILNPLEGRCTGMELDRLAADFGDKLIFHGGIDNQQTLAYGDVQEVRNEVLKAVGIFAGKRWICAPCHNLQPVSPVENIITLYETIHAHGKL